MILKGIQPTTDSTRDLKQFCAIHA